MLTALVIVFLLTYVAIALEAVIQINKAAIALVGAGLMWTIYAISTDESSMVIGQLNESLINTAQVVFFLMGAMAIVEVVDAHCGFEVITSRIKTTQMTGLAWVIAGVTFLLSAILDNLTTTIVMVSLMKKLLSKLDDRMIFAGVIVIAANAGGAWSPIGDVTTTMLWIGGYVSAFQITQALFLPALLNLLVPLLVISFHLKGRVVVGYHRGVEPNAFGTTLFERNLIFFVSFGLLLLVPAFRAWTHLPPFMGVLFALGCLWLIGDLLHREKSNATKQYFSLTQALTRIDLQSIVFFVGILLSVAVLEHVHILSSLSSWLSQKLERLDLIVMIIGLLSAVVDNVPLVAAAMGMYDLVQYPIDDFLWEFLAYCAGTGGSILIIGSAAGVAAMGLESIDFSWYLRKFSGLALLGYLSGAMVYICQYAITH